ncbi:MAG: hypothetical protein CVU42_00265 [Chloroflexi bacterium HGW-Chloroflexi-4]|jgi:MoaA/NifB/PqqE/SkfB family radical SAM enzyme|nr:MAG: hypothetical protein CVU42_00265 [Chloroflexi bacterium HGW-Chloroflexi-4]
MIPLTCSENKPKLVIVWRITETCNLSCWFCEYNKILTKKRLSVPHSDVNRFYELLLKIQQKTNREIMLSWIGGEPFCWQPIWELSKSIKEKGKLQVSVTTNGVLLSTKDIRKQAFDTFDEITFSVDGYRTNHDDTRMHKGLYNNILESIEYFRKMKLKTGLGPLIRVNTIILRQNLNYLDLFIDELNDYGVNEISFNILGSNNLPESKANEKLSNEDMSLFVANLERLRNKYTTNQIKILGSKEYFSLLINKTDNFSNNKKKCNFGNDFLFIDQNGFIAPCDNTTNDFKVHISSITTIPEFLRLPDKFSRDNDAGIFQACSNCSNTNLYGKFQKRENSE